jgi:hypothetical protein
MSKRPSLAETMRLAASAPEPAAQPNPPTKPDRTAPAAHERAFYAATRVGKKKVTASLAPADHKRLRQLALERDATTEALLIEAISDLFRKYGRETIGQGENT